MKLIHKDIICKSRQDRFELFPFGDIHVGKRNCDEGAIRKQVAEVLKRSKMPNRIVMAIFGGDQANAISPSDIRRFDFNELADWFVESDAEKTREMLSDMANQEVNRLVDIFSPIKHLIIGAVKGNHEDMMRKRQNVNIHKALCDRLEIDDLTDEAFIRLKFVRADVAASIVKIYIRHGYGGGRTAGAEPCKLARMLDEWENADVCLTGHSHTYCIAPPKPVLYVPNRAELPKALLTRYRFAANWGCWLLSHLAGEGSYESSACYPARPMMTVKVVVWPFWRYFADGREFTRPKIELREYPIL